MRINGKRILRYLGIFVVTVISLWLLLIGAATISNDVIEKNMQKSALSYGQQDAFAFCDGRKLNGVADNYADSIWLNIAWYMGKGNPIEASLNTKYYDGDELGENAGLYLAVNDATVQANVVYTRYWHGTAGIIRVLHLFTDVSGIKIIGLCVAILLALIITVMLWKEKKTWIAIGFVASLCAVEFWKIGLSMEYQPAFILCFLMSILFLHANKQDDNQLIELSIVGGVLTAFFDFLTTETMVILVPLILIVTVRSMEKSLGELKNSLRMPLCCLSTWFLSYICTFLIKWFAATIVTKENQFLAAVSSVGERVIGNVGDALPGGAIGQSIYAILSNISVLFGSEARVDKTLISVGVILLAGTAASVWYLFPKKKRDITATILLLGLGQVTFLRYFVLGNQSYLHSFFTYRALFSMILSICMILVVNCKLPYKPKRQRKK